MPQSKVLLHSISGFDPKHISLLESFVDELAFFAVVGKDCELWEDAMDALLEKHGGKYLSIPTTSHPSESLEEVTEFLKNLRITGNIKVITA